MSKGHEKNGFVMSAAEKLKSKAAKSNVTRRKPTSYHPEPVPDDKISLDKAWNTNYPHKAKEAGYQSDGQRALKKRLARTVQRHWGSEHNFTVRISIEEPS